MQGSWRKFIAEGARVMVADINADGAQELAAEMGEQAVSFGVDLTRRDQVKAMADTAFETFGGLDILVNNAGITHLPAPMEDVSERILTGFWR